MGLDYSQKQLLNIAMRKRAGKHATLFTMKKRHRRPGLEVYAFWTGVVSTFVSIVQVIILAFKH